MVLQQRTFIDKNEAEIVAGRVFLVDFTEGRCEVETSKEETDGNGLS
jgi:hypothetical protein